MLDRANRQRRFITGYSGKPIEIHKFWFDSKESIDQWNGPLHTPLVRSWKMASKHENFTEVLVGDKLKYECLLCSRQLSSRQNILLHLHNIHSLCKRSTVFTIVFRVISLELSWIRSCLILLSFLLLIDKNYRGNMLIKDSKYLCLHIDSDFQGVFPMLAVITAIINRHNLATPPPKMSGNKPTFVFIISIAGYYNSLCTCVCPSSLYLFH